MQKQKIVFILIIIMAVVFVVPQIVLAAWWNPFSWGAWNRIFHSQTQQQKLIGGDKDSHGCLIAAGYSWCEVKNKCLRIWEEKCEAIKDNYSFNAIEVRNSDKQYPDESIEIYKNQQLVKKIDIKNTYVKPSLFVLSPDQKYVAFRVAIYGGTCVYMASPMVINLSNFSVVNLDSSDINRKINSVLGIDTSKVIKFSATKEIKDIKWISNDKIEATMQFGDNTGCPIEYANKPANSPAEVNTNVDFALVK